MSLKTVTAYPLEPSDSTMAPVGSVRTRRVAPTLRPAERAEVEQVASVWREAWHDGHREHVPEALLAVRGDEHFVRYLLAHVDHTTVATDDRGEPVGLVIIDPPTGEVVQLAVSRDARGMGVATALLDHAEAALSSGHDQAWLAVVPGNARARAFYRGRGWHDAGPIVHQAPAEKTSVPVPVHRYVKQLNPGVA